MLQHTNILSTDEDPSGQTSVFGKKIKQINVSPII